MKTKIISLLLVVGFILGLGKLGIQSPFDLVHKAEAFYTNSTVTSLSNEIALSNTITISTTAQTTVGSAEANGWYYFQYVLKNASGTVIPWSSTCTTAMPLIYPIPSTTSVTCTFNAVPSQTLTLETQLQNWGNWVAHTYNFYYCNSALDICETTPPILSYSHDKVPTATGYVTAPVTTTITCNDGTGSGCNLATIGYFAPSSLVTKDDAGCKTYFTTTTPTPTPTLTSTINSSQHSEFCLVGSDLASPPNKAFKYLKINIDNTDPTIKSNTTSVLPFDNLFVFIDKGAVVSKAKQGILSTDGSQVFNFIDITTDINVNFIPDAGNVATTESAIDYASTTYQLKKYNSVTGLYDIAVTSVTAVPGGFSASNFVTIPKGSITQGKYKFLVYTQDIAGRFTNKEVLFSIDNSDPIISGPSTFTIDAIHYDPADINVDITVPDVDDVESGLKGRTLTLQRALVGTGAYADVDPTKYRFNTCYPGYTTGACILTAVNIGLYTKPSSFSLSYGDDIAKSAVGTKYDYRLVYDSTNFLDKKLTINSTLKQFEITPPTIASIDIIADSAKKYVESVSKIWLGDNVAMVTVNYTIADSESGLDPRQTYEFKKPDGTIIKTGTGSIASAQNIDLKNELNAIPLSANVFQAKYTLTSFDRLGNSNMISDAPTLWIDKEKPTLTINGVPSTPSVVPVSITMSCNDNAGSGCASIVYCLVSSTDPYCDPFTAAGMTYSGSPIIIGSDQKLSAAALDRVNNFDVQNVTIFTAIPPPDSNPPVAEKPTASLNTTNNKIFWTFNVVDTEGNTPILLSAVSARNLSSGDVLTLDMPIVSPITNGSNYNMYLSATGFAYEQKYQMQYTAEDSRGNKTVAMISDPFIISYPGTLVPDFYKPLPVSVSGNVTAFLKGITNTSIDLSTDPISVGDAIVLDKVLRLSHSADGTPWNKPLPLGSYRLTVFDSTDTKIIDKIIVISPYYFDKDTLDLDGDGVQGAFSDYKWFRIGEDMGIYSENDTTKMIEVDMENKFIGKMTTDFTASNKLSSGFLWFIKN